MIKISPKCLINSHEMCSGMYRELFKDMDLPTINGVYTMMDMFVKCECDCHSR